MKLPRQIPLHINILTIFICLVTILSGIVIYSNYRTNSDAALLSANRLLNEISEKIVERTHRVYAPAFLLAEQASLLPNLATKPDLYGHPSGPLLMKLMAADPNILSIYMGYDDGEFYMITHLGEGYDKARTNYRAPAKAHFTIQTIIQRNDGQRVRIVKFLGQDLCIIGSRIEREVTYDPRIRPWYKLAIATDETTLSDLYVYASSKEIGQTVARRVDGRQTGVLGVDLTLSGISKFLAQQKVGENSSVFIFHKTGKVIAYPDETKVIKTVIEDRHTTIRAASLQDLEEPAITALYESFMQGGGHPFLRRTFTADGTKYLARVVAMPLAYGSGQYLAIVIPLKEFTSPIVRAGRTSLIISLVVVLLFIPIIIFISRRISHPIRLLADEAAAIRRFELEGEVKVPTRIAELNDLTKAMQSMKEGLASFSHFVPKKLVERMVKKNITPKLGGERRELTLFFTDVSDFTTLSEGLPAEDLAHKVSRYFDHLGSIIIEEQGTIDKYIGDAVMAFWNAPEPDPDHACRACVAALRCRAESGALNEHWASKGRDIMHTRFGLHTAEVMVGYIGSSDRMDYTAIGSAVNLASRIEGLNKYFGTDILVSESTALACRDKFLFRTVGRVVPKGAKTPVTIYELRGTLKVAADQYPDLAASNQERLYCAEWEAAFALYLGQQWELAIQGFGGLPPLNGKDPVAAKYLEFAKGYAIKPPEADWDGTEIFHAK